MNPSSNERRIPGRKVLNGLEVLKRLTVHAGVYCLANQKDDEENINLTYISYPLSYTRSGPIRHRSDGLLKSPCNVVLVAHRDTQTDNVYALPSPSSCILFPLPPPMSHRGFSTAPKGIVYVRFEMDLGYAVYF